MHLRKATKDEKTRKREEKQEQWAELYYRTLLYILLRIEPHLSVQISLRTTDVLSRVCGFHMCPFLRAAPLASHLASELHSFILAFSFQWLENGGKGDVSVVALLYTHSFTAYRQWNDCHYDFVLHYEQRIHELYSFPPHFESTSNMRFARAVGICHLRKLDAD